MARKSHTVLVRFDQQQLELLNNVKKTGKLGKTFETIIVRAFREYIKQNFGRTAP